MYQVAKKLQGAEKILLCMGYEPVSGLPNEIQELKYGGEVNTWRVIHTAADLVILHSELDRIRDIVLGAVQSNFVNVTLRDILEARSDPNDTLTTTLQRSLACSLVRIRSLKQAQLSQAPAIPPRGLVPQRQQSAQLQLPAMQGQHLSLQQQQDNQNFLPNGRCSSAPDVQTGQSDHWHQPPPSPLLQQSGPPLQQCNMPIIPPNSKDNYNLDKTIDKAQGIGIDSVKYIPDAATVAGSPGVSIPFDPSNLPEPVFDTHDLEMFHQEACNLGDPYASSNMSLLINPRSDNYDDFSGPNLDDHLAYRSHDSGHMGLSESSTDPGSALEKTTKEISKSEQQRHEKESEYYDNDTCTSGSHLKEAFVDVVPKKDGTSSGVSFHVGQDTSLDSQPPSICSQNTQHSASPIPQPRQRKLKQPSEGGLPSDTSSDIEHPPIPSRRSHHNLPSVKVAQSSETPPNSPKPAIVPRKGSPRSNNSNIITTNKDISTEDANATTASPPSQNIQESSTIDDGTTSGITLIESDNLLHSEAHTSHESGSPHPSLESKPSMSDKSDPCSSTPSEEAPSACSSETMVFKESVLHVDGSENDWVEVSVDNKDNKDAPTSLDSQPRPRAGAFSAKSDKIASDKSKKPKSTQNEEAHANPSVDFHTDLQNAIACWYCTNLTSHEICDICGNRQFSTV